MLLQLLTFVGVFIAVHSASPSDIPARYLCGLAEGITVDEEFDVDPSEFELRGISVVFRHGERSAIAEVSGNNCAARHKSESEWNQYKKVANSKEFAHFLHVDARLSDLEWIPEESLCGFGQLTAEGALSLRTLGRLLARKYAKIIKEDTVVDMQSTYFNRTLQSGVALISEMLYGRVPTVTIKYADTPMFCNQPECKCLLMNDFTKFYRSQYMEYLLKNGSDLIKNYVNGLTQLPDFKDLNNPIKLFDHLIGKYLCRNKPLPCGKSSPICVTGSKLVDLFEDINTGLKGLFRSKNGFLSDKIFHAHAFGALSTLKTFVESIKDSDDEHHVQLLSAHDVTVGPLMRTLNMTDFYDFPSYNSRAIFEIYRSRSAESELFVRLVYNGKQRKMRAVCPHEFMCPWSKFKKFIENVPRLIDPVLDLPSFCSKLGPFELPDLQDADSVLVGTF